MKKLTVIQRIERLGLYLSAKRPSQQEVVRNVGALFVINMPHVVCKACKGKFFYEIHEIIDFVSPIIPWPVIATERIGIFCNVCGSFQRDSQARRVGTLGGHVPERGNLFNTLNFIEANALQFPVEPTREELLKLEATLKKKLNAVRDRLAILGPAYRGS